MPITEDDPSAPRTLDELRAAAGRAAQALAAAEADAAIPTLSVEEAQVQLAAAEQALEFAERPHWDVEHAKADLGFAREEVIRVTKAADAADANPLAADGMRTSLRAHVAIIEATVAPAEAALAAAETALAAHPINKAAVDAAAQAVIDARASLAKAEAAAKDA